MVRTNATPRRRWECRTRLGPPRKEDRAFDGPFEGPFEPEPVVWRSARARVVARRATRGARGAVLTRHRRPPRRVHRRLPPLERLHRVHVLRAGQGLGRAPRGFDCRSTRRRHPPRVVARTAPRSPRRPGALLHSLRGRRRFLPVVGSARRGPLAYVPGAGSTGGMGVSSYSIGGGEDSPPCVRSRPGTCSPW